jgi:hypothetical protein
MVSPACAAAWPSFGDSTKIVIRKKTGNTVRKRPRASRTRLKTGPVSLLIYISAPPGLIYTLYMDPHPGWSWSHYLVLTFVKASQQSSINEHKIQIYVIALLNRRVRTQNGLDGGTAAVHCVSFWTIGAEKAAL